MEFNHTPGPWLIDEANPELVAKLVNGTYDYICSVDPYQFSQSDKTHEQNEANVRLIAAAPEMLEDKIKDFKDLGPWLSAALDDPKVCDEFKKVIYEWLNRFNTIEKATGLSIEKII